MMQLEVGKYYKTRDGRKVGPMVRWDVNAASSHPFEVTNDNHDYEIMHSIWSEYGTGWKGGPDLIEEWPEEPAKPSPTLSAETIDHIAIDSLKFHAATELDQLEKEAFRIVLRYYGVTL